MKSINKIWKTVFSLSLALLLIGAIGGFNAKSAQASDKVVWMQSIYKDNGNVNVIFKVDVSNQLYTEANAGYIYVKDVDTDSVTRYTAQKISSENGEDTYKAVYTPDEGQNTKIKISVLIPSSTGHPYEYYDDNDGNWYQA